MKTSDIFIFFGFIFLFGFVGIMAINCLPIIPKESNIAALFLAVIFGITGIGLIFLARKERLAGR